ncbi:MAG: hypothetical protein A2086_12140 [Spirochaetes bacterium GWD1_27_9]|nr:MAG: hypothetical protein A2Y34_04030 [Spirochaetes bacterium GWC1_27_15]OHD28980.1 MAG: hypothetical protein A2086_12140 [Spirochaetes bacterium GWD1_27_9]
MIRFLLKKTFLDIWDNLFLVILINSLFFAVSAASFLLFKFLPTNFFYLAIILFCFLILFFSLIFLSYLNNRFKVEIIKILFASFYSLGLNLIFIFFGVYSLIYYFSNPNIILNFLGFFLIWILISYFVGSIFYYPLLSKNNYINTKSIKKSFILLFDNLWFTLFVFLIFLINIILIVFLIFGIGSALIFLNNSLNIILKKYDYIEKNNFTKKVDWDEILKEDKLAINKINIRSLISPFK